MAMIYIRGFEDRSEDDPDFYSAAGIVASDITGGGYCASTTTTGAGEVSVCTAEVSDDDSPDFSNCYVRVYVKAVGMDNDTAYWELLDSAGATIVRVYAHGLVYIGTDNKGDQGFTIDSSWVRLEFKVNLSVSGQIIVKIDGTTYYTISTDLTAYDYVYKIRTKEASNPGKTYMDDIVINDTSGTKNNSWPDAGHVYGLTANAVGTNSELTPSPDTGEDNYEDVDEAPNDADTSYVVSNADEAIDTYGFTALPEELIVKGVAVHTVTKLESAGTTKIKAVTLYSGNYEKKTVPDLATDYERRGAVFEDAPDGNAWTKTKIDAAEFGIEVEV